MKRLAIIPARGGSKRIPKKNIKAFHGKPIIAYAIEAAIESNLFDEVMVSTDDDEIAEISKQYGAKVPFYRSQQNSGDFSTTTDVLKEVLSIYSSKNRQFDTICCLYPCTPFVTSKKLVDANNLLMDNNANSVFPVIEYSYPIQRSIKLEGTVSKYNYNEFKDVRSQDLEKTYHDSGQFYFMKSSIVLNDEEVVGNNSHAIVVSELESQDIDTETDWKLAEIKYQLLNL